MRAEERVHLAGPLLGLGAATDAWSPDQILAEILDLARKRNGEISKAEVLIASELEKCPHCGGTFAKPVEGQSLSGGERRMDE